jgi:hypothetical protein
MPTALNESVNMRFKAEELGRSVYRSWSGLIRRMFMVVFVSYRPERHYMRGPGPKWREKHARPQSDCF